MQADLMKYFVQETQQMLAKEDVTDYSMFSEEN